MKPRIGSIVATDWPALFCLMSIPVIWLLCAQLPFVRRDSSFGAFEVLAIAVPFSLLAGGLLAWRIVRIHRLFARGHVARARIKRVDVVGDRGRVEFEYDFGGVRMSSWTPVYKNKLVASLVVNQEIEVLVDPTNPGDAIVRELYV
jgi:hypothetical protein